VFKELVTLLRGQANAASDRIAHNNAMVILDQQIRDAGASIGAAQRSLALAIAEDRQEAQRTEALAGRIANLEARARAALSGNREDLAILAAGTIAELQMDRDASTEARALLGAEIARLRRIVGEAERRFADVQRGRRVARVAEAVGRSRPGGIGGMVLRDAESTLAALRTRQLTMTAAEEALDELTSTPARIEDRLGQFGFGPVTRPTAATVLAKLKPLAIAQS
jgi:phage shock protein A